ncbi:EAL domain-containing protein [Halobacillus yeomjeoni]|uniref:EAL domain-containing protein n=1 Tax=Halobacillus yeomjeoni TaxID=311194 RepID=A0A931HSE8_9BACI|nr:EAL domain-containing protein [Halobacillus yeomjeoni]MBH0228760.1 EAL domain-containing protein [Halobacillus yeomjeoni]
MVLRSSKSFFRFKENISVKKPSPLPIMQKDQITALFDSVSDSVYYMDKTSKELVFNQPLSIQLGYTSSKKRPLHKYFEKKSSPDFDKYLESAFEGNTQIRFMNGKHKDGSMVTLQTSFIPHFKNEMVMGVFIIFKNISQVEKVKTDLQVSNLALKLAETSANLGTFEYNYEDDSFIGSPITYEFLHIKDINEIKNISSHVQTIMDPEDFDTIVGKFTSGEKRNELITLRYKINSKDGDKIYKSVANIQYKEERPYLLTGIIQDITKEVQTQRELQEKEQYLKNIYNNLSMGLWCYDMESSELVFASKGLETIYEIPLQKFYDKPDISNDYIHPDDVDKVQNARDRLSRGERIELTYRINLEGNQEKWLHEETIPIKNEMGDIIQCLGALYDITPQKNLEHEIDYLSKHDDLTGLPNRREFERIFAYWAKKESFTLMSVDIDRFKYINETLGLEIGDEVLVEVGKKLSRLVKQDGLVFQFGSDEYIILLDTTPLKSNQLAKEIIKTLEIPFNIQGYDIYLTVSIGISFYPTDGKTSSEILQRANIALNMVKRNGKNNFKIYSSTKNISTFKKYKLEKDMRTALCEEQFELYYQPRIDSYNGNLEGAEALLRWNHPEWGLISPGLFIPMAVESGFIIELSEYVIEKACQQIDSWRNEGLPVRPVSVNISPRSLMKENFIEVLTQNMHDYNIKGEWLELEITEDTLLTKEPYLIEIFSKLKEMEISIAIDDFGTGYTSFTQLKEFDIDIIKIDKSFIKNCGGDSYKDNQIISSMIHLAHGLGIQVVAEGVEEAHQYAFLKQKECDQIQGYYFSKPLPAKEYEYYLHKGGLRPKSQIKLTFEKNRRQFYRMEFPYPLLGAFSIVEFYNERVVIGKSKVLIENISIGGLKFITKLQLPVNPEIRLRFNFKLFGKDYSLDGKIVWKDEVKPEIFQYGVQFYIDEPMRDELADTMNKLYVYKKNNKPIPESNFIDTEAVIYLNREHQKTK